MLTLAAWYISVLVILFVLVSIFMMLIILVQKPKGGGLSGAFGGAGGGSSQAAFGAKVGDVLTWATVVFFLLFLFTAMGLTWTINPEQERLKRQAPAAAQTAGAVEDEAPAEEDAGLSETVETATPPLPETDNQADEVPPVGGGDEPS